MNVEVICNSCAEIDEEGNTTYILMVGNEKMYTTKDSRTQSREFTCPSCNHSVLVVLSPNEK